MSRRLGIVVGPVVMIKPDFKLTTQRIQREPVHFWMQEARQRQGIDNRSRNARQAITFITGVQKAHIKADVVSRQQTAFTKVLEHLKDLSF